MSTSQIGIKLSLDGAASVTSGLAGVQNSLGSLAGRVETVRSALAGFAPALASAFTVGGLVAFVRNTTNAIDAMNDLADATGASIEEISKLDQVARRNGASLDAVGSMLVKFNAQLKEADGKNGASLALQAIGLEAAKLRQLDPAEALQQTARALAGFADDGNKARIVQELFGKSVREAAPFLKDLAEAGTLSAKVTKEQAEEAEKFNKQLSLLGANATDAARGLVSDLIPALNDTLSKFNQFSRNGGVLSGFFTLLTSQFKDARVQATLEEIGRIQARLANPNVTGFNRSTLQQELRDATAQLERLRGEAVKAGTALDKALGRSSAGAGRGDDINPPFARRAPAVIDIAAEQARRKAAEEGSAALAKQIEAEAKATAAAIQAREKYVETLTASAAKMAQENQALADQVKQVLLGKDAYQALIDLREEEQAVLLETQAIRALDRNLDQKEFEALKGQAAAIRERIALRRALTQANAEAVDKAIMAGRTGLVDQDAAEIADTNRLKSAQDIVAAIGRETAALSMSNVEREVSVALLELERLGIEKGTYAYDEYASKIREAIVNRDTVRRSIQQTEEIQREWQRTADQIGQSLTDALMQGGKSAWEYIKGLFRSMVLRPIIQAVVNPIASAFTGSMGGPGALGTLGGINSLATLGSVITGSVASSIGNVMGTAGTLFGSSALTSFAAGMKGATLAPGLMGPTTVGASGAMGAGASVAAAIPYVAAALAVANALGVFRSKSIVGGGLTGTLGMGDIQSYDLQRRGGTLFSGPEYSMVNRQTSTESAAIQSAFEALRTNAASMAEALGLSSTAVKSFTTVLGTDITQNDIGTRGIKLDGLTPEQAAQKVQEALAAANEDLAAFVLGASRTVTETLTTSVESWSETEQGRVFNGFVDQVSEVTRTVAATGPSFARTGETAVQTLTRLAGSISTINPVLEALNLSLYDTSLAGADLASQLADAFGGLEAFTAATSTYYQEFFSEAERTAAVTAQLTETLGGLGLALPTTREAFRDLVEAQDLNTESGRKAFATLVGLSGTFAALVPEVEAVEDAAEGATQALRSAADILREREGLERELLQLQGNTTALRALDRAALDESNRALFDRITALQDSQAAEAAAAEATRTAAAEAAEAARAAAAETQRITQERLGLERQLLNLQGDQAAIRSLERAALDSSNRALYDQITALQDSQAAAAAAAQAQRDYTAAVQNAQAAVQRAREAVASAQTGVDAVRAEATNAYLAAQDRVAEATKRIADLNNDLANRAREAALQMRELGESLQSFVRGQTTSPQAQFAQTLREAMGGDQAAMRNLPQAAEAAIEAARLSASTAAQAAIERARILSSVSEVAARAAATAVPDAPAAADPMAEAAQALATAQQSLAEALSVANQIGAPLSRTVEDLVSRYATAQQDLAQAVADLATAQAALAAIAVNTGDTVAAVKNLDLTLTVTENTLDVQLRAVAESDLPDYIKALIADAGKEYLITIDSVMAAGLSDAEKTLLLQSVTTASRSVILAAAFSDVLTADEKKALNAVNETVKKTIDAAVSSGTLTADQRTVLSQATETVAKTVTALVNSSNLSAEQRNFLALVTGSASTSSTVTVTGAVTFDPGNALQSIFNNISKSNALLAKVALAQLNPTTSTDTQKATVYAAFRELYTDAETRKIAETLYGPQTDTSWNQIKKLAGFALGGVFTNGIVTQPTLFNMAQMGEAGPEAIMPLSRGADGSLGVRMFSDAQRRDEALVAEIRALRAEVVDLRAEARATAVSTNKTARILERVTPDGASLQTVAAP